MNKSDYWFLDLAIEAPAPFSFIIPYETNIAIDAFRAPFSLTVNQITETMYHLFQDGFLSAITPTVFNSLDNPLVNELLAKSFIPSHKEIRSALEQRTHTYTEEDLYREFSDEDLFYFVTKKGGEIWESLSKPKWNQFFRRWTSKWEFISESSQNQSSHLNNNVLWCTDRDIGSQIIKIEHLLDYPEYVTYPIVGTERWETITPWHPTYWKTLSSGFVVNYQVECRKIGSSIENPNKSQDFINQRRNAREWYSNIAKWYSSYYG